MLLLLGLTCPASSVDVRWRPLVSVAVVTQLVTHLPRGAIATAAGLHHPPQTGLAMPDVVRRLDRPGGAAISGLDDHPCWALDARYLNSDSEQEGS
jgi:hypothetical protein